MPLQTFFLSALENGGCLYTRAAIFQQPQSIHSVSKYLCQNRHFGTSGAPIEAIFLCRCWNKDCPPETHFWVCAIFKMAPTFRSVPSKRLGLAKPLMAQINPHIIGYKYSPQPLESCNYEQHKSLANKFLRFFRKRVFPILTGTTPNIPVPHPCLVSVRVPDTCIFKISPKNPV